MKRIDGKYELLSGKTLSQETKQAWGDIVAVIERFLSADIYIISVPMWNFSIPYTLKHYIDVILQPKYLFEYTSKGPQGLLKNKKMIIVTSRGGDYSSDTFKVFDFQQEYLRTVFGVAGIVDIKFIHAQPMDAMGLEAQKQKIQQAQQEAVKLVDALAP